jgi:hypothetical protein
MITTKAMPALLPAHHRRVAEATIKNDFADLLSAGSRAVIRGGGAIWQSRRMLAWVVVSGVVCTAEPAVPVRIEPPRVRWRLRCFGLRHDYRVTLAS